MFHIVRMLKVPIPSQYLVGLTSVKPLWPALGPHSNCMGKHRHHRVLIMTALLYLSLNKYGPWIQGMPCNLKVPSIYIGNDLLIKVMMVVRKTTGTNC